MSDKKEEKVVSIVEHAAAAFFRNETPPGILATLTKVEMSENLKYATIFLTIYPENNETSTLKLLRSKLSDFRELATEKTRLGQIPFFRLEIDRGEKNRQHIDSLTKEL